MPSEMVARMICLPVIALFCGYAAANSSQWHTTPDKWKEPRIFQTPASESPRGVSLGHHSTEHDFKVKVFSPNKAYWFAADGDRSIVPRIECDGTGFLILESNASIYVYTERDYLLRIRMRDHYPNFTINARWVNERLLFVRVWWGRVLGSDVIVDVESERVVHSETIQDGTIAFQQWRQHRE
jgi:hypothetical protein